MNWAVEIEDMTVAYDRHPVLWDVDMKVPQGALAAVLGPNGAGKSTLLKAALGLIPTISGRVKFYVNGTLSVFKEDKKQIVYVPQSGSVDWDFPTTVLDGVLMGRYGHLGGFEDPARKIGNWPYEHWKKSVWPITETGKSNNYPAANNNGYSWPEPWFRTEKSISWTNRSRASIKRRKKRLLLYSKK